MLAWLIKYLPHEWTQSLETLSSLKVKLLKCPTDWSHWKQEEKGMTEDEVVGWHHWFNGHEFEQVLGDGEGQGSLVCHSPWGRKSQTWLSDWTATDHIVFSSDHWCYLSWVPPAWVISLTYKDIPNTKEIPNTSTKKRLNFFNPCFRNCGQRPYIFHHITMVAQAVKNLPAMRVISVQSLGWEDPLEESTAIHSSILAWRILMDRGAWWATVHGVAKSWTRATELNWTEAHSIAQYLKQKQLKCPSIRERINRLWYIHMIEYISAIKKKKRKSFW